MAFRIQPNAARDAFDGMITGAPTNATLAQFDSVIDWGPLRRLYAVDGIMRRVGAARERTLLGRLEKERKRALSKLRSPSEGAFATLKR